MEAQSVSDGVIEIMALHYTLNHKHCCHIFKVMQFQQHFDLLLEREILIQCHYQVGYITWSIIGKVILRAGQISYDASKGVGGWSDKASDH